jgi:hypothetical protein
MYLKSGGVAAVLSGAMVSMSRLLEKRGPELYSPEYVEGTFCQVPSKMRPNRRMSPAAQPATLPHIHRERATRGGVEA